MLLGFLLLPTLFGSASGQSLDASLPGILAERAEREGPPPVAPADADPWQRWNRHIFTFNEAADIYFLAPVARGWRYGTPGPLRTAIHNVSQLLPMPAILANGLLQLQPERAAEDVARVMVNLSFGIVGLIDVATKFGIPKNDEDFGQSLGFWGVPPGPYFVLPFFGPSNLRDAVGRIGDGFGTFYFTWAPTWVAFMVQGVDVVNRRSLYLEDVESLRRDSLDYYVFMRDAYTQLRQKKVDRARGIEEEESRSDDLYYFEDDGFEDDGFEDGDFEDENEEIPSGDESRPGSGSGHSGSEMDVSGESGNGSGGTREARERK
jgi:phospholipid-binding lipoprotein MlaA